MPPKMKIKIVITTKYKKTGNKTAMLAYKSHVNLKN